MGFVIRLNVGQLTNKNSLNSARNSFTFKSCFIGFTFPKKKGHTNTKGSIFILLFEIHLRIKFNVNLFVFFISIMICWVFEIDLTLQRADCCNDHKWKRTSFTRIASIGLLAADRTRRTPTCPTMSPSMRSTLRNATASNMSTIPSKSSPFLFLLSLCDGWWGIHNPRTGKCAGCKQIETEGFHLGVHTDNVWSSSKCTQLAPTDAYGKLNFPSCNSKTAQVFLSVCFDKFYKVYLRKTCFWSISECRMRPGPVTWLSFFIIRREMRRGACKGHSLFWAWLEAPKSLHFLIAWRRPLNAAWLRRPCLQALG